MKKKSMKFLALCLCLSSVFMACGDNKVKEEEVAEQETVAEKDLSVKEKDSETQGSGKPSDVECVTSFDQIDADYLANMTFVSEKVVEYIQTKDCPCTNPYYSKFSYDDDNWDKHLNFDSYKLVGRTVAPCHFENNKNIVGFIYELHYSQHTEVTTYAILFWYNVYPIKTEVFDVTCHDYGGITEADGLKYFGYSSLDELKESLRKPFRLEDGEEIVIEPVE